MIKIRYAPGVGLQYKIVGGHKFQYFTPGREYTILEICGRAGFRVKDDSGVNVWVSYTNLRKYFPQADAHAIKWKYTAII